ncbi:branched-chain amino acid ABC transporter permease [Brevibacillus porteri]|uniref:Branched-chain amino acid ABC transporter permease n=1 Tax=Brevibacillus porteri TaxID=2126350 RepID=A0ABX5FS43_9BACL|nr:branched-chain amino acid ABC transporter permease [Brevibacillus porteri]MED1797945.1 branched-chain amino acid ABC transporter permease [Brevibacillus porteri]MED2132219.1 branched-chain amino acid ABC transporter permease [Brevibacillus porteri]MED2748082.1 branched-chain amino acid ABC transporter permease [Brevibacillus porteri]MED2814258.1 branched-chain amino acid ABC transporter permease [Brevibacillus porteri]MED2893820.1 branched-chain amino acid ABC transporter permease [Brevibac
MNPSRKKIAVVLLLAVACVLPFLSNNYWLDVATLALFYVVLAQGLNVVVGFAGLLDLGYAAFFAVGAYTTGILMTVYQWSFWLTLPVAMVFAAIVGVIIGAPTLRLRSDYLAIVTLGFGEIIRILAINLTITGSASGIYGIPRPSIGGYVLGGQIDFYYLNLIIAVLAVVAVKRLGTSRIGRAWMYIREDEDAAEAMGINRINMKLLAYSIGAVIGSLAGSVFAVKMSAIAPLSFSFTQSIMILLAVVLGGLGSIPGVVLGAVLVIALPELLRSVEDWRYLIFGAALVAMMLFRPQGLWPARYEMKRGARRSKTEEATEGGSGNDVKLDNEKCNA